MEYKERRSAHALEVDRAIQAEQVYGSFTANYASAPNESDVESYDTRIKAGSKPMPAPHPVPQPAPAPISPPMPEPVAKPEPKIAMGTDTTGEYIPTVTERRKLVPFFHKLHEEEQYKDLLTTKNVIKKRTDADKWEKNPKYYDIRGIDTQPEEMIDARLSVVQQLAGNPTIIKKHIGGISKQGAYYTHQRKNIPAHSIVIRKTLTGTKYHKTLAHELGHAYDYHVLSKRNYYMFDKRPHFENQRPIKELQKEVPYGFVKKNKEGINISDFNAISKKGVVKVTQTKISPYDPTTSSHSFHRYRSSGVELFANWFSGLITDKRVVKKESKGYYNMFRKANKPLIRALKTSDRAIAAKFMIKGR